MRGHAPGARPTPVRRNAGSPLPSDLSPMPPKLAESDVSVVIPVYNRAAWLERAVASILCQTLPPLEVIVVDDGSTDGTGEVCRRLEARGIRVLLQSNQGVSAARNAGARAAEGAFIAFLDSDDLAHPSRLELQRAVHDRFPGMGWSFGNFTGIEEDDTPSPGHDGFPSGFPVFRNVGQTPEAFFASFPSLRREELRVGETLHHLFVGDFFPPSSVETSCLRRAPWSGRRCSGSLVGSTRAGGCPRTPSSSTASLPPTRRWPS